jgi:hypothetical protein
MCLAAWCCSAFATADAAAQSAGDEMQQLRSLVESGQSAAAYQRYCTTERTEPAERNLWCGIALVDIGRPGEGILILERYVLLRPDDMRGRLELARAYFLGGDDVRARTEFEAVAAFDPPAAVRAGIDRYLDALFKRESLYRRRTLLYVEAGAGWDSNVNAGVAQADLTLPVLGPVTVIDRGVERDALFGAAAIGGQINQPFAPGFSVFGAFDANGTFYREESDFNLTTLSGSGGVAYERAQHIVALSLAYGELHVGSDRYRTTMGAGLEWRYAISPVASIAVVPQYARLSYEDANEIRDADLGAIAINYRRAWLTNWQPAINLGVFYGDESSRRDRPDLTREFSGAALELVASPSPRWAVGGSLSYTRSDYDGPLPLLGVVRKDDYVAGTLRVHYFVGSGWSARVEYTYAKNDSNVSLFEFDRSTIGARVRREFK